MYIPLGDELAEEINRRINDDDVYAQAGLSLISSTPQTTTSPSETTTGYTNTVTKETCITSGAGFAAIAGTMVACLALITCSIITGV